jgi:DNA-binding response OmpR family regulator
MTKILIIEDDESICNELSILLEKNNYQTIVLKDFKNAFILTIEKLNIQTDCIYSMK